MITIVGSQHPCKGCVGAMKKAKREYGSDFEYYWKEGDKWNKWTPDMKHGSSATDPDNFGFK